MDLFANYFQWTVTAGGATTPVAGTSESFTVSSSTGAPAASNTATPATVFRIVDAADTNKPPEVMTVTNVSGTTWTVTRGAEGAAPWSHAANWTAVPVATAGALAGVSQLSLISRQVLGAGAATVTFSSIPGTFENLVLVAYGAASDASATINCAVQFNGDTGNNYVWQQILGQNNSLSATGGAAGPSAFIGYFPGSTAPANSAGLVRLYLPSYARTLMLKTGQVDNVVRDGATTAGLITADSSFHWLSAAAISSIALSGGTFITGSVFSLYGES